MTRSLGASLPSALEARLSQRELPVRLGVVLPLVTVDAGGSPHPMLLSYLEVRARSAERLAIVIGAVSRSARNLAERQTATLLVIEPDAVAYIKLRVIAGPLPVAGPDPAALARFELAVEDVLEDAAAAWEADLRITSAATYSPAPRLDAPWVRATLAALEEP